MGKYLTKSKYKLAMECPRKFYYLDRPKEYENSSLDDPFLKALARGGFQVGELAKLYFPGSTNIEALGHEKAVEETNKLLGQENVIIYEAAFMFEKLFVRVDILRKRGSHIELIEVKSKSFDPDEEDPFFDKRQLKYGHKKLVSKWKPYLYDIAFQTYVCRKAMPEYSYTPYLMLSDKSKKSTIDGLNQLFFLYEENGRTKVKVHEDARKKDLGEKILTTVNVDEVVDLIIAGNDNGKISRAKAGEPSFESEIDFFSKNYSQDKAMEPALSTACKGCEFRAKEDSSLKSGFSECWTECGGLKPDDIYKPFVFDVWNFRKADGLLKSGVKLACDIVEEDIGVKKSDRSGFSSSERQLIQVEAIKSDSKSAVISEEELSSELISWRFPLHFIDFETTMVAIPFNSGKRPYEQVAFQFSHHVITEDGKVEHRGEYLDDRKGVFPNFDFVRALKLALEGDAGTIFRYAAHENTVLCQIYSQLLKSNEPDKEDLCDWIKTVTTATSSVGEEWEGERSMVDLCDLVKSYYYHPLTGGSNSIKKVLPAILNESRFLREKYSNPIYGAQDGIKSLNFKDKVWLVTNSSGGIVDPYKQLPPIFENTDLEKLEFTLFHGDELADGGAAMTAYAKMQFTEMSDEERSSLRAALLKYCELDTLAMVMLYEYWAYEVCGLKAVAEKGLEYVIRQKVYA